MFLYSNQRPQNHGYRTSSSSSAMLFQRKDEFRHATIQHGAEGLQNYYCNNTTVPVTLSDGKQNVNSEAIWGLSLNERLLGRQASCDRSNIGFVSFDLFDEDDFLNSNPQQNLVSQTGYFKFPSCLLHA